MKTFRHAISSAIATLANNPQSLLTDTNFEQIQNLVVQNVIKYLQKENIELTRGDEY
ncbi:MAG: hypothetical protein AAGA80_08595 [Cyanobacteria bacterium P01_F01_bin.143]